MWNAWSNAPGGPVPERPKVKAQVSVSLDGFMAGPDQSRDDPLGRRGEELHEWFLGAGDRPGASSDVIERATANVGATVMGRNMFGGGPGGWGDGSWKGWWGDDPPFHTPVFVLTHHEREPVAMEGGTTFHFVTDGLESALETARLEAGQKDVWVGGGASTIRQCLLAGGLDEIWIHTVPIVLGSGERIFDGSEGLPERLVQVEVVEGPGVAHVRYRIV